MTMDDGDDDDDSDDDDDDNGDDHDDDLVCRRCRSAAATRTGATVGQNQGDHNHYDHGDYYQYCDDYDQDHNDGDHDYYDHDCADFND